MSISTKSGLHATVAVLVVLGLGLPAAGSPTHEVASLPDGVSRTATIGVGPTGVASFEAFGTVAGAIAATRAEMRESPR